MVAVAEPSLRPLEPPDHGLPGFVAAYQGSHSVGRIAVRGWFERAPLSAAMPGSQWRFPKYLERILRFRRALDQMRALASGLVSNRVGRSSQPPHDTMIKRISFATFASSPVVRLAVFYNPCEAQAT